MRISQYSLAFVLLLHTLYVAVKSDDKNCHSFVSALAFTTTPTVMRPHRHVINRSPAMNAAMSFSGVPSGRSGARGRVMLAQYTGEGHEDDNFDDQKQSPEPVYYDDFDFSPGANSNVDASKDMNEKSSDPVAENQPETLSNLFQNSRDEEDDRNSRIIQNWENGNWKCRGFSLDKFNPVPLPPDTVDDGSTETGGIDEPMQQSGGPNILSSNSNSNNNSLDEKRIEISKITFDETALGPGFGTTSETIAVGRTDGTVYIVQLGNEYLTKFQAVPKVSMGGNWDGEGGDYDNDGGAAPSARIEMEMINQEERVGVEMSDMNFNDLPLGGDVNLDSHIPRDVSTPFVIECQFQAHGRDEAISALLFHDDTLFTSAKGEGKGMIKVWDMHGASSSTGTRMVPLHNLDGAHRDEVVVLKTLSSTPSAKDVSDHNLLLSASKDGSFAMWDMKGDLVYRCELLDDDGNPTAITCADVDTSGEEHIIYLGLSSGHVVGYVASDLIGDASEGKTCPVPKCRFLAHDPSMQKNDNDTFRGVTAIACGGPGQMSSTASSSILLTGGADGVIKQFQMIQQKRSGDNDESWNLAYWPRLPTQRMKDCSHIFDGHYDAVTALVYDGVEGLSKIISSGADGTIRVWNPSKGVELYRMDGFEGITSLCHDREILVTNGMNEYVCVHDFDVAEDLADSSYDLNW